MSFLAKAATVVSTKGAAGLAVALLALGAASVATEAAVTGSVNPTNWGQAVEDQVTKCKDALKPGQHGIGQCVSAFAKTNGPQIRSEHASGPRTNTPGPPANPGKPSSSPGGRPSTVPPTSHP